MVRARQLLPDEEQDTWQDKSLHLYTPIMLFAVEVLGWGAGKVKALTVTLLVIRPRVKMPPRENRCGEVREWSNRHAWKACVPAMGPWVRIPPSPPTEDVKREA